jgi:hypothetical protein
MEGFTTAQTNNVPFTLGDWAERFDPSAVRLETADRDGAGMTQVQWEAVREAVLRNPNLGGLVVSDVTHRDTLPDKDGKPTIGNNVTFTNEDMVIVGFVGTTGPGDWYDNGVGGYVWVTDTAQQVAALQYFEHMTDVYGRDHTFVLGHSKGGNLAQYVTVVSGVDVDHCYTVGSSIPCGGFPSRT